MINRSRSKLLALATAGALAVGLVLAPGAAAGSAGGRTAGIGGHDTDLVQVQQSAGENDPSVLAAPAEDGRPNTVPAVQQWTSGGADFTLGRGALRLQIDVRHYRELAADAETVAEDLRALTGRKVVVGRTALTTSPPAAPGRPGAIRLTLDASLAAHGDEASRITVDSDITVAGATTDGMFSGTRTVLQLLRQSDTVAGGVAVDWPGYAERSFMIDNGRKYFSLEWTKRQIRELSYLKYNQFHWHLTDNQGFRIESDTHPEVLSDEYWTKDQVRELVAYAAKYHLEVVPEIDMPGHMLQALRTHPDLQIVDADGDRYPRNLDPTDPAGRAFVKELLDELIPLFPGRYVHTGGDEFTGDWDNFPVLTEWAQQQFGDSANAQDAVLDFTNWLNGVVRAHGKTMRIWNDGGQGGVTQQADRTIQLDYWSDQHGDVLAQTFLDQGFQLMNSNRNVLYGVPGVTPTYNNLDPRKIYDAWSMGHWHDTQRPNTTDPHADGILGGQLLLWNDNPDAATQEQVAGLVQMPLRAMSQQLWDSPRPGADWDDYSRNALLAGTEPSWTRLDGETQNLALGRPAVSSARERPDCQESNLVDGDLTTRWCGPKTSDQQVIVDLGSSVDLGTVALRWETAFASGYRLSVSDDLESWREVYSTETGDGGLDLVDADGQGRFLRLSMTERGTKYGYSLYEIGAYAHGALVPDAFGAAVDPAVVLVEPDGGAAGTLRVSNATATPQTIEWSAAPPAGIGVTPSRGSMTLPAGGSAEVALALDGSDPGTRAVPITVTGQSLGTTVSLAETELLVAVPYDDIADSYNNVGVTSDAEMAPPTLGTGLDGAGSSFSAEALAAIGIGPGTTLDAGGVPVGWPGSPVATPNNVVANGQSITVDGAGDTIGLLTTATYGPASGDWTVHYTDGSAETVSLATPDWTSAPPAGSTVLATMSYRNNAETGRAERRSQLFYQSIAVDPAKTVAALTLPVGNDEAVRGTPAIHVFDVAVG